MLSDPSAADHYAFAACGLLTLGLDGQIERANATFCQLIGWDAASLIGKKRFQELLTMGSRVFHHTHWMPLLQMQRSVAEVQLDLVHRDGRTLAALVNAALHAGSDARESVQVAVFIATDRRKYERELLLARRRAEELLASEREAQMARTRAEERLRLALDAARLYTWNVELPSGIASYERRVGELLGAEMDGVPAGVYADAIHRDDREREQTAFALAVNPDQRALYSTEYRLIGLDGVERIIQAVGRAFFDEAGAAVALTGVLADLTSQRRAEDALREREVEFRMLAENSPDIIARFDRSRRFLYVNESVQRLLGISPDALTGARIDDEVFFPAMAGSWSGAIDSAFAGSDTTLAFSYQASDGSLREFQSRVVPERNSRGDVVTVLGITRDVTALKAQEREAEQRALLAEQLIGIVSHDLRNPLNAVLLGTHLLRAHELSATDARVVARIASSAERATRLVADLLDFTQARLGGGLRVEPRPVDLQAVVFECVEELKLAWQGRMIAVNERGSGVAELDPDRLAQVIGNLASNALTYGAVEHPITITSCLTDERVEIAVHNHGRPIPTALLPQIFEPLRRGDHNVKLGSRSIGLGLYIVRQIATAHGGSVTVSSNEEDGTTFLLDIPRATTAPAH
jgi:sigma-B regulation protein RsbU (phosphoserine phosphatase)